MERQQESQEHEQQEQEQQALPLQQLQDEQNEAQQPLLWTSVASHHMMQQQQLQRDMVKTIAESALLQDKVLTLQRDMANALEEFAQNAANLLTSSSQTLHDNTSQLAL